MSTKPLKYYWEDMAVGSTRELGSVSPTREQILDFARQFDPQPFHLDEAAARPRSSAACAPAAGTPAPWPCA